MPDCPNCAAPATEGERLCPSCGFDLGSAQADDVRRLREEGKIHPGRLNASDPGAPGGVDRGGVQGGDALPAEDTPVDDPRTFEGGL
jgi:hypothetical protein